MGYAGQVTFGHNAFAALGGYGSAVLTSAYGWPPIVAFAAGMALALAVALLVGYPTLRLKGHYLAMATLAIGLIVYEVAVQWQAVTGGYMGISGIPPVGIGRSEIVSDRAQLTFLALMVVLATWSAIRLRSSRFGRALVAIAGSEDAARALGIDVAHYKLMAFLISAAYAALAGSLKMPKWVRLGARTNAGVRRTIYPPDARPPRTERAGGLPKPVLVGIAGQKHLRIRRQRADHTDV